MAVERYHGSDGLQEFSLIVSENAFTAKGAKDAKRAKSLYRGFARMHADYEKYQKE